jgi:hypothetical protein
MEGGGGVNIVLPASGPTPWVTLLNEY